MGRLIISKQLEKASGQYYTVQSDVNGDLQFVTVASIVAANETTTSVTDNTDGTFDYVDENGGTTTVSIPYVVQLAETANPVAETMHSLVFIVPSALNGKEITRFNAYFGQGAGTHTISLRIGATTVASVTSLTAPGGGSVGVTGHNVATGDVLSIIFTTTVTGFGLCFGTATIV